MARKNFAIANESVETPKKSALRIEKAAGNVSNELDKVIHATSIGAALRLWKFCVLPVRSIQ